jgi:transposase-like protein
MSHYAFITDDRGVLQMRRFATAADAAAVSATREPPSPTTTVRMIDRTRRPAALVTPGTLPDAEQIQAVAGQRTGDMRHTEFARRIGIAPRTLKRQWLRGGLPGAKQHTKNILVVPVRLLRLAEAYGLRQVERMAQAGLL